MQPERWRATREILERLLEEPIGERPRLLEQLCQDDPEMRSDVESLLGSHEAAGGFLEQPAWIAEQEDRTGERVGPFLLERLVGRGGMGTVYLAHHPKSGSPVAVKIIRRELASPGLLERFARERRILEQLDHSHIARLLEAGSSADGLPYLAMAYVPGAPIGKYCDQGRAAVGDRVRLMIAICDAVAYAHRKGIVHRDLKPGNILVEPSGQPVLLDFGLAKLLEGHERTTTLRALTPRYASPEQLRGLPVGPPSDVYSLGVLMSELLCGVAPHDQLVVPPDGSGPDSGWMPSRALEATRPPRELEQIARQRDTTLSELRAEIRGDLDAIVARATHPAAGLRYVDAAALGADLERYWSDKPVRAPRVRTPAQRARRARARSLGWVAAAMAAIGAVAYWTQPFRTTPIRQVQRSELINWAGAQAFPAWAPDGRSFAFVSVGRGATSEVWIHDTNDSTERQVYVTSDTIQDLVWSPDGRRLGFGCFLRAGGHTLRLISVVGTAAATDYSLDESMRLAGWTADGIVVSTEEAVWRIRLPSGTRERLTPDEFELSIGDLHVDPRSGRAVIATSAEAGRDIWVSDASFDRLSQLTRGEATDRVPRWAGPNGDRVMFLSNRGGSTDVWELNLRTGALEFLTASPEQEQGLAVSPDGLQVLTVVGRDRSDLWRIDPRNGEATQLTMGSTSELAPAFTRKGRLLFHRTLPTSRLLTAAMETEVRLADLGLGLDAASVVAQPGFLGTISPDERWVSFVTNDLTGIQGVRLHVRNVETGASHELAASFRLPALQMFPHEWLGKTSAWRQDSTLYFAVREGGIDVLQRADLASPSPRVESVAPVGSLVDMVVDPERDTVAWSARDGDLWRVVATSGGDAPATLRSSDVGPSSLLGYLADGTLAAIESTAEDEGLSDLLVIGPNGSTRSIARISVTQPGAASVAGETNEVYLQRALDGVLNIWAVELATGRLRRITTESIPGVGYGRPAVSPDGFIVVSRHERNQDIVRLLLGEPG